MSEDKTYNGWTNYETWNVKLWMDNDQGPYSFWQEQAQNAWDNAKGKDTAERIQEAECELSHDLQEYFDREACDLLDNAKVSASVWADLLHAALSEVDWHEIAESLINEVDKENYQR